MRSERKDTHTRKTKILSFALAVIMVFPSLKELHTLCPQNQSSKPPSAALTAALGKTKNLNQAKVLPQAMPHRESLPPQTAAALNPTEAETLQAMVRIQAAVNQAMVPMVQNLRTAASRSLKKDRTAKPPLSPALSLRIMGSRVMAAVPLRANQPQMRNPKTASRMGQIPMRRLGTAKSRFLMLKTPVLML